MTCTRLYPEHESWVQFELLWNQIVGVVDLASWLQPAADGSCLSCAGDEPSLESGCESNELGPEIQKRSLTKLLFVGKAIRWHKERILNRELAVGTNPICEVGRHTNGRCFMARSYPYQCWQGAFPLSCLMPFRRCSAYNAAVPCSACSRSELKWFNSGKYWARLPGRPCIAFPLIFQHPNSEHFKDRMEYDERNKQLVKDGITDADIVKLQATASRIRSKGFDAFGPLDYAECSTSELSSDMGRPAYLALNFSFD